VRSSCAGPLGDPLDVVVRAFSRLSRHHPHLWRVGGERPRQTGSCWLQLPCHWLLWQASLSVATTQQLLASCNPPPRRPTKLQFQRRAQLQAASCTACTSDRTTPMLMLPCPALLCSALPPIKVPWRNLAAPSWAAGVVSQLPPVVSCPPAPACSVCPRLPSSSPCAYLVPPGPTFPHPHLSQKPSRLRPDKENCLLDQWLNQCCPSLPDRCGKDTVSQGLFLWLHKRARTKGRRTSSAVIDDQRCYPSSANGAALSSSGLVSSLLLRHPPTALPILLPRPAFSFGSAMAHGSLTRWGRGWVVFVRAPLPLPFA
jgi:hypothetical protein